MFLFKSYKSLLLICFLALAANSYAYQQTVKIRLQIDPRAEQSALGFYEDSESLKLRAVPSGFLGVKPIYLERVKESNDTGQHQDVEQTDADSTSSDDEETIIYTACFTVDSDLLNKLAQPINPEAKYQEQAKHALTLVRIFAANFHEVKQTGDSDREALMSPNTGDIPGLITGAHFLRSLFTEEDTLNKKANIVIEMEVDREGGAGFPLAKTTFSLDAEKQEIQVSYDDAKNYFQYGVGGNKSHQLRTNFNNGTVVNDEYIINGFMRLVVPGPCIADSKDK